jgi:hypothetical protein
LPYGTGGAETHDVAIGFLNADVFPDLVVANYGSDTVGVLLGAAGGTFLPAVTYAAGDVPSELVLADFNRDGRLDLAVANNNPGLVTVLLGTGTGAFGAPTSFAANGDSRAIATGEFNYPNSVATGSLRGDASPDLAVADFVFRNVFVLTGTGSGSFGGTTSLPTATGPVALAIADLDADGRNDILVANSNVDLVSVFFAGPDGTFGPATTLGAGDAPGAIAIAEVTAASLAVTARTLSFGSSTNNVGTLAVALTGANAGFLFADANALTIGEVGDFAGIATNTGQCRDQGRSGELTVSGAVTTVGTAAPNFETGQVGQVTLLANNGAGITVNATITGRGVVALASGAVSVNAALDAGTGELRVSSQSVALGADLSTDGGDVTVRGRGPASVTGTVLVDTDRTAGGNAGRVTFGNAVTGTGTLVIVARETAQGAGQGGLVAFEGPVRDHWRRPQQRRHAGGSADGREPGFSLTNAGALTIGQVDDFAGLTTNTGNIAIATETGGIAVARAITTAGAATPNGPGQAGSVGLFANNGGAITIDATVSGRGVALGGSGAGLVSVNAAVDGGTGTSASGARRSRSGRTCRRTAAGWWSRAGRP